MPFLISIVTPCFNSEKTIRETIESVVQQGYPRWEHLVLDGGSTDGTLNILKDYPHLRVWSEKDEGHYDAMNKGIQRCKGEAVVILNADDCYRPGAFQAVAAAFERHPDWDGLFGDVVFVDGRRKEIYRRKEPGFDYDALRFGIDYICHHTLFVRPRVYEELGSYRHRELKNCCDYDFILRMGRARKKIGHVPEFLVDYRFHEFGQSADRRISENMWQESVKLKREHGLPEGSLGKLYYLYGHARRQMLKLIQRGTVDIIPAKLLLRRHMRDKSTFSSNIGLDKL